jgi:limonene 1,2-monooxygenase
MPRLSFGAFLAPHHPIGEHPMLQFRRDLDLVEHLDKLGYDEFWCGEHHSSGWEMIGSPEIFLVAPANGRSASSLPPGSSRCPITIRSTWRNGWCSVRGALHEH